MSIVPVHVGIIENPFYQALKKRLGENALEGVLRLWCFCLNNGWEGFEIEEIEKVFRWKGEPGMAFAALFALRFVGSGPGGLVYVNSFEDIENWFFRDDQPKDGGSDEISMAI